MLMFASQTIKATKSPAKILIDTLRSLPVRHVTRLFVHVQINVNIFMRPRDPKIAVTEFSISQNEPNCIVPSLQILIYTTHFELVQTNALKLLDLKETSERLILSYALIGTAL